MSTIYGALTCGKVGGVLSGCEEIVGNNEPQEPAVEA